MLTSIFTDSSFSFLFRKGHKKKEEEEKGAIGAAGVFALSLFFLFRVSSPVDAVNQFFVLSQKKKEEEKLHCRSFQ